MPVDDAVRPRIWIGKSMSARDYLRALAEREKLKRQFAGVFANIDALLTPTTTTPPIPIAAVDQSRSPAVFTRMVNLLDLCALSLPNGFTAAGLPTSLQIVCRGYDEGLALRIGWAYEQVVGWLTRLPPMF
jgi:aspartyl-tRNA(Asn)/glutamyl-tRNA(Gln) amidotransferase subunit A